MIGNTDNHHAIALVPDPFMAFPVKQFSWNLAHCSFTLLWYVEIILAPPEQKSRAARESPRRLSRCGRKEAQRFWPAGTSREFRLRNSLPPWKESWRRLSLF